MGGGGSGQAFELGDGDAAAHLAEDDHADDGAGAGDRVREAAVLAAGVVRLRVVVPAQDRGRVAGGDGAVLGQLASVGRAGGQPTAPADRGDEGPVRRGGVGRSLVRRHPLAAARIQVGAELPGESLRRARCDGAAGAADRRLDLTAGAPAAARVGPVQVGPGEQHRRRQLDRGRRTARALGRRDARCDAGRDARGRRAARGVGRRLARSRPGLGRCGLSGVGRGRVAARSRLVRAIPQDQRADDHRRHGQRAEHYREHRTPPCTGSAPRTEVTCRRHPEKVLPPEVQPGAGDGSAGRRSVGPQSPRRPANRRRVIQAVTPRGTCRAPVTSAL